VSIVRVGLGETENFAEGYEAIFGKKDEKKKPEPAATADQAKKEVAKDEKM
jgi:hypothetical protein